MYYTRTINPLNPYRDEKEISLYTYFFIPQFKYMSFIYS